MAVFEMSRESSRGQVGVLAARATERIVGSYIDRVVAQSWIDASASGKEDNPLSVELRKLLSAPPVPEPTNGREFRVKLDPAVSFADLLKDGPFDRPPGTVGGSNAEWLWRKIEEGPRNEAALLMPREDTVVIFPWDGPFQIDWLRHVRERVYKLQPASVRHLLGLGVQHMAPMVELLGENEPVVNLDVDIQFDAGIRELRSDFCGMRFPGASPIRIILEDMRVECSDEPERNRCWFRSIGQIWIIGVKPAASEAAPVAP